MDYLILLKQHPLQPSIFCQICAEIERGNTSINCSSMENLEFRTILQFKVQYKGSYCCSFNCSKLSSSSSPRYLLPPLLPDLPDLCSLLQYRERLKQRSRSKFHLHHPQNKSSKQFYSSSPLTSGFSPCGPSQSQKQQILTT